VKSASSAVNFQYTEPGVKQKKLEGSSGYANLLRRLSILSVVAPQQTRHRTPARNPLAGAACDLQEPDYAASAANRLLGAILGAQHLRKPVDCRRAVRRPLFDDDAREHCQNKKTRLSKKYALEESRSYHLFSCSKVIGHFVILPSNVKQLFCILKYRCQHRDNHLPKYLSRGVDSSRCQPISIDRARACEIRRDHRRSSAPLLE
jgi:hypothetical protein